MGYKYLKSDAEYEIFGDGKRHKRHMRVRASLERFERIAVDLMVVTVSEWDGKQESKKRLNERRKATGGPTFSDLDAYLKGHLSHYLKGRDFKAHAFETVQVDLLAQNCKSILVLGWPGGVCGPEEIGAYRKLGSIIAEHVERNKAAVVALLGGRLNLGERANVLALLEGLQLAAYKFEQYKSASNNKFGGIAELLLLGAVRQLEATVREATILDEATLLARDLVNIPANDCTPAFLMRKSRAVARRGKLKFELLDQKQLEKLGAGAFLAVARGSDEPSYLMKLVYRPAKKRTSVIGLVGKGVTFDSGGLSIKAAGGMETMKCDMSGAAAVICAMQAIAALKPAVEVRAYIPTTENMISGRATRPGDIVKALNGKTIEILNTDAEGRLILADALSLAVHEECDVIIDVATLTGACMVALGMDLAGVFSNDDKLFTQLLKAAQQEGEQIWRMPLLEQYCDLIKSPVADLKNTAGQWGGAINAALFLREFVGKTKWAHIDMVGPAFSDSNKGHIRRGGTGFGVRTLVRYIMTI